MSDELAVMIFAAENGFENEAEAKATMYKHGFAEQYVERAEKLAPVFQRAYLDGIETGVDMFDSLVREITADSIPPLSPMFDEGVRAAIKAFNRVFDIIKEQTARVVKDQRDAEPETQAQAQPEQEPEIPDEVLGLLKAIFGPNVRVEAAR